MGFYDYRELNSKTRRDAHPLPRIDDLQSDLLVHLTFNQRILKSKLHKKTGIRPHLQLAFGLYEYTGMPFGLCNAPATFQRLMQVIFRKEMYSSMLCYLDDILVYSSTIEEHINRLDNILEILETNGLKLKSSKCIFPQESVNYLGHVLNQDGVKPDPRKTEVIEKWEIPKTVKELRTFMGFTGY